MMESFKHSMQKFIWAKLSERRISKNTQAAYMHDLVFFREFYETRRSVSDDAGDRVSDINYSDQNLLQDFYLLMRDKNMASATIARRLGTVIQFMKFCNEEDLVKFPIIDKPIVKLDNTYSSFLEVGDLEKLRQALSSDLRLKLIIELLYSTGMRISELLAIKVVQLSRVFETKYIIIKGKGGHERAVFFNEVSLATLQEYLHLLPQLCNNYLFASRDKQLTRQRVFQLLKDLAQRADVAPEKVFPHSFRHRMLTDLVRAEVDLVSVQKIAGHKQINTTARYTHVEDHLYEDIARFHPINT